MKQNITTFQRTSRDTYYHPCGFCGIPVIAIPVQVSISDVRLMTREEALKSVRGLTSHSELYRLIQGDFYRPDDPTNSIKALKEASWPLR